MPNGAMKSDFREPAERARLLLKHTRTLLFPRMRDGRCVAAFRWEKKTHLRVKLKSALQEVQTARDSFYETSGEKMKNGLNDFLQTFRHLRTYYSFIFI